MGIISDYLELCRCNEVNLLDPCMIIDNHYISKKKYYNDVQDVLMLYKDNTSTIEQETLKNQLVTQLAKLEMLKCNYLIGEKNALYIYNSKKLQSHVVINIIQLLCTELEKSYKAICELQQQINNELHVKKNNFTNLEITATLEEKVQRDMLRLINSCVINNIETNTVIDTSMFRKIIMDCAFLIKHFEKEYYNQPSKKIVRYYWEKKFELYNSNHRCLNCHQPLLEGIRYCLNCYERN